MINAKSVLLVFMASFGLAACGGGAGTTDLPPPQTGGGNDPVVYTGTNPPRDEDVSKFLTQFWNPVQNQGTCGDCHNEATGQMPMFARFDDINMAYDDAVTVTNMQQPSLSRLVEKVGLGHNCWNQEPSVCSAVMTTWIENWVGDTAGGGRQIVLIPPPSQNPGDSKNFPDDAFGPPSFEQILHQPILTTYCSNCHSSEAANAIQPYFADPDVNVAYEAAKSKIDLDDPASSRFVIRLRDEFHNCWSASCTNDGETMRAAIANYSGAILPTTVDQSLVYSKALRLIDGTVASGGNRYENDQIGLWEFKTGSGLVAYDTSGVAPALDLNLSGNVEWYGGWGITINDGKAQGSTTASAKLFNFIQQSGGQFSIEAWVIPANVTQEEARIVSFSAGTAARNFTLQQTLYNYDYLLRTNETSLNGDPALSTPDADEVLQATLQHVVATYDPVDGRSIYVNGELVTQVDPVPGGNIVDWQDTFAFVLGNEASGDRLWQGTFRLVAMHDSALTQEQIQQNFDVGVGEKFYMLFDISDRLPAAAPMSSYILFEVAQYDTYSYLFDKPHFITLDGSQPTGIAVEGLRIAMNGQEVSVGQSYANLNDTLSALAFGELGQPLSALGAVLPLSKGPDADEFFLTFDRIDVLTYNRPEDPMLVITPTDLDPASHIGVRTFDEISATFAAVTGVDPNTTAVDMTYQELRQSLPAVEDVNTFLSSHQVAIAQLAIEYCNALIEGPGAATYFTGFNFNGAPATVLAPGARDLLVDPLITNIVGNAPAGPQLGSQPTFATVYDELAAFQAAGGRPDNLIDRLIAGGSDTRAISKGVCAATLGSGVTLVQ